MGSQNLKWRIIPMYGVCPSSHSKGVLKSNELRAAWLRMKHTHSIQQPSRRRCTGAIEEMVHLFFDILVTAFSKVLMLEMGLCLPIINTKMAQDVLDLLANVQSGSITNQLSISHLFLITSQIVLTNCLRLIIPKSVTLLGSQADKNLC